MRVLLLLLISCTPALAKGPGQFEWGQAAKSARKVQPRLRPSRDAVDVAFERRALAVIRTEERRIAKAKGPKAFARWKRDSQKPLKPRFSSLDHWIKLDGLATKAELHFIDGTLYGATTRVLFNHKSRPRAAALLDTLQRAYGAPRVFESPQPARLLFSLTGGSLEVHKLLATKKRNGMLRHDYRATELGGAAAFRREALKQRLRWAQKSETARQRARAEAAQKKKDRRLLKHL